MISPETNPPSEPLRTVRVLHVSDAKEIDACIRMERETWGAETHGLLDHDHMVSALSAEGILIGAFDRDELIGFVFSYRIPPAASRLQHSHLLAVAPSHRDRGYARKLKLAQQRTAYRQGDSHILWTFDPLEAVNASLNIGRLGATAHHYLVDFYGDTGSHLHRGLPTDRLLLEWKTDLGDGKVRQKGTLPPLPLVEISAEGLPLLRWSSRTCEAEEIFLPIPPTIQRLKQDTGSMARSWRDVTRRAFQRAFESGFVATDFAANRAEGNPGYLLTRRPGQSSIAAALDLSTVPFSRPGPADRAAPG